jgi:acetyl esterase/lipase
MIGFSAGAATALQVALTSADDARPAFVGLLYCPPPPTAITLPAVVPPLFAAVAADDPVVGPDTSALDAWRAAGKTAEFHLYGKGGHGFGMRRSGATTDLWPDEFLAWVRSNGFLQSGHTTQP